MTKQERSMHVALCECSLFRVYPKTQKLESLYYMIVHCTTEN